MSNTTESEDEIYKKYSLMSRPDILEAVKRGDIYYEDGKESNIKSSSVDLTLGPWYWEETSPTIERRIFNPNSAEDVNRVWGRLCFAPRHSWWLHNRYIENTLEGFHPEDRIYFIAPQKQLLTSTREFIGGTTRDITTMMKARSGAGRSFLEVCRCAGWGDIGYHNRWTMEFNNSSDTHYIPLKVGQRYAQLVFFRGRELGQNDTDYRQDGKYQANVAQGVRSQWTPEMMRPAMFRDPEIMCKDCVQKVYYRCENPACAKDGADVIDNVPKQCADCGTRLRIYETPPVIEKVWPLYDVCVDCGCIHGVTQKSTRIESRNYRLQQEVERAKPLLCDKCKIGFRHFIGGDYEVWLPDASCLQ
jgi:dCTP deaminase